MAASTALPWFTFLFGVFVGYFGERFFVDRDPVDAIFTMVALTGITLCFFTT
jgi:Na+-translocating ferredoxin:NAD+ oxidoreductase RNF subunit RnfB